MAFRYAALSKPGNEIRLLRLNRLEDGEYIDATLIHHALEKDHTRRGSERRDLAFLETYVGQLLDHSNTGAREELSFAAVSYMWGKLRPTKPIRLNGDTFLIRPNLERFLVRLMEHEPTQPPFIWVDGICINQEDDEEKSHQIGLMTDIYSLADRVFIWLGELDGGVKQQDVNKATETVERMLSSRADELLPESVVSPIVRLSALPYWDRIWMVQEVVLARYLRVFWGGVCFEGSMLEGLNELAQRDNDPFTRWRPAKGAVKETTWEFIITSPMGKLLHLRQVLQISRDVYLRRLWVPVLLYTKCAASVAHDKVYGLLGLTQDNIEVDYKKPLVEVYRAALGTMGDRIKADFEVAAGSCSSFSSSGRIISRDICPVTGEHVSLLSRRDLTPQEIATWIFDGESISGRSFQLGTILGGA